MQAKRCWFFRNGFDCYKRAGVDGSLLRRHRRPPLPPRGHRRASVPSHHAVRPRHGTGGARRGDRRPGPRRRCVRSRPASFYRRPRRDRSARRASWCAQSGFPQAHVPRPAAFRKLALYCRRLRRLLGDCCARPRRRPGRARRGGPDPMAGRRDRGRAGRGPRRRRGCAGLRRGADATRASAGAQRLEARRLRSACSSTHWTTWAARSKRPANTPGRPPGGDRP